MAITKSAKLAIKKSESNKIINDRRKKIMKDTVKTVRSFIEKKDSTGAVGKLAAAFKALDKAAKIGIIKKNEASRKKSRLAKGINKIAQ